MSIITTTEIVFCAGSFAEWVYICRAAEYNRGTAMKARRYGAPAKKERLMRISGLQKTTLLDFPGRVALIIPDESPQRSFWDTAISAARSAKIRKFWTGAAARISPRRSCLPFCAGAGAF